MAEWLSAFAAPLSRSPQESKESSAKKTMGRVGQMVQRERRNCFVMEK
jgi:hypothetical protein